MEQKITVGISDLNVVVNPNTLISYALGSCIGICLYDKYNKIAGLSHILLPDSTLNKHKLNLYRFADTAIIELIKMMIQKGGKKQFFTAKVVGGANMFDWEGETIGEKNIKAVKKELIRLRIPVIGHDVGGDYGRTVSIDSKDGKVTIRALSKGTKII